MKHQLKTSGLSLSQATSISNMCYQRAHEIENTLMGINNATRTFKIGADEFTEVVGKPIPKDIEKLLSEKAKLHAVQGFLVSNIKAKDELLKALKVKPFETKLEAPEKPEYKVYDPTSQMAEGWGWDQLTEAEFAEYIEAESFAAHIGKFIHKGSPLDHLRTELPKIQSIDWIAVKEGERTPVKITTHHKPEELMGYHERLATLHRGYEQRVNYFKAKVKNLITEENAHIARANGVKQAAVNKENEDIRATYDSAYAIFSGKIKVEKEEFEAKRQEDIKATAALRIGIDARFQETIDGFLKG